MCMLQAAAIVIQQCPISALATQHGKFHGDSYAYYLVLSLITGSLSLASCGIE